MTTRRTRRPPRLLQTEDSGSATVLALMICAVVTAALSLVAAVTLVLYGQHRAASSADLAALAGAAHLDEGAPTVCAAAAAVARANHTVLVRCQSNSSSVSVSVRLVVHAAWWTSWTGQIVGRARAGYESPGS
jgi:secretion/DNA translocation related TadE-like protein